MFITAYRSRDVQSLKQLNKCDNHKVWDIDIYIDIERRRRNEAWIAVVIRGETLERAAHRAHDVVATVSNGRQCHSVPTLSKQHFLTIVH